MSNSDVPSTSVKQNIMQEHNSISRQVKVKRMKRHRVGELLVKKGLITEEQLQEGLNFQRKGANKQICSILYELGFIGIDDMLLFLSQQFGVPSFNLFKNDIDRNVLDLVPIEMIVRHKVLPVEADGNTITMAMITPSDFLLISDLEFTLGRKIAPVVVPAVIMDAAIKSLSVSPDHNLKGSVIAQNTHAKDRDNTLSDNLDSILAYAVEKGASDIFLTSEAPPSIKVANTIKRMNLPVLTSDKCEKLAKEMLSYKEWQNYTETKQIDCGLSIQGIGRFRVNIFQQRNSVSIAIRNLPITAPSFSKLNLPDWLMNFALSPSGLILVSGPAGHGKSTTISAIIEVINQNRHCNIITLEDPIECLHIHKKSNINQREVGRDTPSFAKGLQSIYRQAPDVIVIGELRDIESFEIALQAASTGHLVLSSVHAANTTSTIERVINMFPGYRQSSIRTMLAGSLLLCLSQRLVPIKHGSGRVPALEKLINSYRIKNFIREEKTYQIRSQMQAGSDDFCPLDLALAELYKAEKISYKTGLSLADDESLYRELSVP